MIFRTLHHCILCHVKLLNNAFSIFVLLKNCTRFLNLFEGNSRLLEWFRSLYLYYLYIYIYIYIYIFAAILVASFVASMAYWLRCWIPNSGVRVQDHWMAPRLTQLFILSRLVKWVPAISREFGKKNICKPKCLFK